MSGHTDEEKSTVLACLQVSADTNDGVPVWKRVSRDTGIPPITLKRWWAQRLEIEKRRSALLVISDEVGGAHAARSLPDPRTSAVWEMLLEEVAQTTAVLRRAEEDASWTAVATLRAQRVKLWERCRIAYREATGEKELTDSEVLAELALATKAMPPHHAQVVLAELRKRGLAA